LWSLQGKQKELKAPKSSTNLETTTEHRFPSIIYSREKQPKETYPKNAPNKYPISQTKEKYNNYTETK